MNWLDQKYIGMLSGRLRNFKRKSSNLYNFSCPICGDSASNKSKARGFVYEKKGTSLYHCHNCSITLSVPNFLKMVDSHLHGEYLKEKLLDSKPLSRKKTELEEFVEKLKKPKFISDTALRSLKKVSQLNHDHPCKVFVDSRKIPTKSHSRLFWCPKFLEWSNGVVPGKFSEINRDHGRLLIPFIDEKDNLHAFQGRSISADSSVRYITIVVDESVPKIYGLDKLDKKKKIYVLEGPIDSMFLSNAIATAGGDLSSSVKSLPKENLVIVYDNEPRSAETQKKIEKAIIQGYRVCVWPTNFEHKDVNDAILAGLSSEFVQYIIDQNTYSDLRAMMSLKSWSKR